MSGIRKYWIEIALIVLCTYKEGILGLCFVVFLLTLGHIIGRALEG